MNLPIAEINSNLYQYKLKQAMKLDEKYWTQRYQEGKDGWDIGYISTPLKDYIDQLTDKDIKILIPGAGNSYEAEYIFRNGFKNLFVCDLSATPLENLKSRAPDFPSDQMIKGDFFEIKQTFDLVLEQTFFCALHPTLRPNYVTQMAKILQPKGKLVGLLFSKDMKREGPPFGGSQEEYIELFSEKFHINIIEPCTNSIQPRMNSELFIHMQTRKD